ncbi:MAG: tRNA lysidine(34) synthetase TilS [Vampirovibrionales bacterium]|nr:tRNA lysidine(34) synthetase TilS [Vampirovibrionales bacterium]
MSPSSSSQAYTSNPESVAPDCASRVNKALTQWLQMAQMRLGPSPKLLVAYSGGLDSTVLLHAVSQIANQSETNAEPRAQSALQKPLIGQVSAVLYHHNWRGTPPPELARVLKNTQQFKVSLVVCSPNLNTPHTEKAAREVRYEAFRQLAEQHGASAILTAHHQDDQVETLLMRLLRGTGPDGMAGIRAELSLTGPESKSVTVFRPFLNVPRAALMAYAKQHELFYYEDPTNQDTAYKRNAIRHDVLKTLEAEFPQARQSLLKFSALCADDAMLAADAVQACQSRLLTASGLQEPQRELPLAAFQQLLPAYQRRVMKHFLDANQVSAGYDKVMRCIAFVMGENRGRREASGLFSLDTKPESHASAATAPEAMDSGRYLVIHRGIISIVSPARYQFPLPGKPCLCLPVADALQASSPQLRVTVGIERLPEDEQAIHKHPVMHAPEEGRQWAFYFNQKCLGEAFEDVHLTQTFLLRTPRPGDVYKTAGGHQRKFKRLLAESGMPALNRMALPVLAFHNWVLWAQDLSLSHQSHINVPVWFNAELPATHCLWIQDTNRHAASSR